MPIRPLAHPHRTRALPMVLCTVLLALSGCASGPTVDERARDLRIAEARRNVGVDFLASGRTAMAIRELQHALLLNPDDPETVNWLGEAYRRRGLLDKALELFLQAVEMDPSDHQIRLNLAAIYIQLRRFQPAIDHSQVLIDDPTFPAPWAALTNRGWAQFSMGHLAEARASFEEALEFKPDYWPARLNLGILENEEGNRLAAITNFEQMLEGDLGRSAESEANYRIGEVYLALGRRNKAVDYFRIAAERAPTGRWGRRSEEYLKLLH